MNNWSDQSTLPESAAPVIEAYVNGSCLRNGSKDAVAGLGCVIKTHGEHDSLEVGAKKDFEIRATSTLADYSAVVQALSIIERQHSTNVRVHVYTNLEVIVGQLQGSCAVRTNHLKNIHAETKGFFNEFHEWRITHLSKSDSSHMRRADEIARTRARGVKR